LNFVSDLILHNPNLLRDKVTLPGQLNIDRCDASRADAGKEGFGVRSRVLVTLNCQQAVAILFQKNRLPGREARRKLCRLVCPKIYRTMQGEKMKTAKSMLVGLLFGATADAALAAIQANDPAPGLLLIVYTWCSLLLLCLPALYIIFRRGLAWRSRLAWLLGFVVINIGSYGFWALVLFNGGGDVIFTPIPWVLALIPGLGLTWRYKYAVDA
jgi:hypothetical protein